MGGINECWYWVFTHPKESTRMRTSAPTAGELALDTRIHKSQVSDQWETWLSLFQMVWNYCFWCERGSWCPFLLKWEDGSVTIKHCSSEHVFWAFLTTFFNAIILLPDHLSTVLAVVFILGYFHHTQMYILAHSISCQNLGLSCVTM